MRPEGRGAGRPEGRGPGGRGGGGRERPERALPIDAAHRATHNLWRMRSISANAAARRRGRKCNIMANAIRNFRDLDAWQSGMDLVLSTYDVTSAPPDSERYGLRTQMQRAAVSIPSNIAEGHAFRTTPKACKRHVRIALGSLAELETHIEIGLRLKFLKPANLRTIQAATIRTGQLLHGLLRALNMRGRQAPRSECRVCSTAFRSSRPLAVRHAHRRRRVKARVAKTTKRR